MRDSAYQKMKDTGKLPSPSGVALELLRLVDDEAATVDQIAKTVQADPALASRLLQLVNSPLSGASRTVASVSTAVTLLGVQAVKNLALGLSLLSANRDGESKAFDFDRYWSESLARAVAARNLASHFKCCAPDEAFTIALLSRVGRLAMATAFPHAYDGVLEQLGACPSAKLDELERIAIGIDQNELTAEMMREWRLADVFCESVRCQDSVDPTAPNDDSRVGKSARLLRLAGRVAFVLAEPTVYQEDLTELLAVAGDFGLQADVFADRFDSLNEEWPQVAAIFSVHARAAPSIHEAHTRATRENRRILVVDDDPSVLRLLTKYLSDAGYDVLTATQGMEALRIVHSEGCQLVITDWMMPDMDGLEFCRAIRKSESAGFVYIIVLTGEADTASLSRAFDAGADDFLTKPCKREELLARLKAGVRAVVSEAKVASQQRAIHKTNVELATLNQRLQEMATTDELTGLYNRRKAMQRLAEHWSAADRLGQPFACLIVDIDHFKRCNDTYGHDAGDAVLRETARVLEGGARAGEVVFRIGGEEFLVTCPGATAEMAAVAAERLRAAVEAKQIVHGERTLGVTISVGVAAKSSDTASPDDLLKRADEALYASKRAGRNGVSVAGGALPVPGCVRIADAAPKRVPASESLESQEHRGSVLVVDDDPAIRRLYRRLLERDGFQVHEAGDGLAALELARALTPDVILMDVEMPGMSGLECTRNLQADPAHNGAPIIFVSGNGADEDVREGLRAGAQDYIMKPFRNDEFVLRVRAMSRIQRGRLNLLRNISLRGEQVRAMRILFDLSCSLASAEHLDAIITQVVTATAELMRCGRVSIMIPDDRGRNLSIAGAIGIETELSAKIQVPVGSAIAGRVFASGEAIVLNTQGESTDWSGRYESDFFASVPLASKALVVPEKVVGVLNITERHGKREFERHEIEYLDLVCNMAASAMEQFRSRRARVRGHSAIVIGLATLAEYRDSDTGKHLERVNRYALLLAAELRRSGRAPTIDDVFMEHLGQAMPLHDIGKVAVSDSILLKRGALTDTEFSEMKRHVEVGATAIQTVIERVPDAEFLLVARDIARHHHERFDGTGYPCGLRGDQIPLPARIAAVADVYDALTTKRPYKDAFTHEHAAGIIRESAGAHFDPEVVDAFLEVEQGIIDIALALNDEDPGSHHTDAADMPATCFT